MNSYVTYIVKHTEHISLESEGGLLEAIYSTATLLDRPRGSFLESPGNFSGP